MNEQWRQQLREKMADYQRPAPEISWDEIDKVLDARKAHKTRLLWWWRMAAAAVLLLIAGAGYWGLHHDEETTDRPMAIIADNQQQPIKLKEEANHETTDTRVTSVLTELQGNSHDATSQMSQKHSNSYDPVPSNPEVNDLFVSTDTVKPSAPAEKVQPRTVEKQVSPITRRSQVIYPSDLYQRKHLSNRLTAKVYLSNTMNNSYHTESSTKQITNTTINSKTVIVDPTDTHYGSKGDTEKSNPEITNPYTVTIYDTIRTVKTLKTNQHIRHRQPIRFGLSLRYRLNDRWSVESGLSYTRLTSDITTITDGVTTVDVQRLNYIGLPLNIGYQLWANRHFGLYVTAGGTIEKMLDASPWQFSINGAAGAEYKLTNHFSLYAEPGIGYYLPNGSATPTIYQDHPLNFNLSFGLRFNLK